jgi:hypothetical protein
MTAHTIRLISSMNVPRSIKLTLGYKAYSQCLREVYMKKDTVNAKQEPDKASTPMVVTPLYYLAVASLVIILFLIS